MTIASWAIFNGAAVRRVLDGSHRSGFQTPARVFGPEFILPLLATLSFCVLFAKDSPNQPAPRSLADYAGVLRMRDTWWLCLFYSITFGGFVGLASFLNVFFLSQYGLSRVEAGNFTTLCVIAGSFLRPLGGYLADRLGGVRTLTVVFIAVGAVALGLTSLPPLAWEPCSCSR